jgi:hypothetical protein
MHNNTRGIKKEQFLLKLFDGKVMNNLSKVQWTSLIFYGVL